MKLERSHFTLSTGRRFYAHGGILGLSESDPGNLFNGYDGVVEMAPLPGDDEVKSFTDVERKEIADYMTALWSAWAARP